MDHQHNRLKRGGCNEYGGINKLRIADEIIMNPTKQKVITHQARGKGSSIHEGLIFYFDFDVTNRMILSTNVLSTFYFFTFFFLFLFQKGKDIDKNEGLPIILRGRDISDGK